MAQVDWLDAAGRVVAAIGTPRFPAALSNALREVAPYVLRHRIVANYQAAGEGITAEQIVKHLLTEIGQPQYA